MKRVICIGFCTVVLLLSAVNPAAAKFDATASLALKEMYTDNIFLTRTNRDHDFITIISPSVGLKYIHRYMDLSLNYGVDFKYYSRHSNLNESSLSEIQNIKLQNQFRPFNRVFIDVSDTYKRVPIDNRKKVAFENLFVDMTDSNVFYISPRVEYPLSPTLLTNFGYRFTNVWYKADEGNDSDSHSAFFSIKKIFSPSLTTALKYDFLAQRPKKTEDYDRHQGSVAVTYLIGPQFVINGEIGEAFFDYKIRDDEKLTFWNLSTDYKLRITEGTTMGASYSSSFSDSITEGVYKSRKLDLRFQTGTSLKLTINPYYTVDKYLETGRKDKVTAVALDVSKALSGKIDSSIRVLYERQKFQPDNEKIIKLSIGSNLDYKLNRYLTASVGYTHNNNNSDNNANDFHNNVVWLKAKFTF